MQKETLENLVVCIPGWQAEFLDWDARRGLSQHTLMAHRSDLESWCEWFERANGISFTPDQMNSFDLRRYRQYELDVVGIAPATWNRQLASLRVLAEWIRKHTDVRIADELFEGVGRMEEVERPPEWLNEADFARLGRYVESTARDPYDDRTATRQIRAVRDRALAAVMLYAGLRVMEVADLQFDDVDITERKGRITVRRGKGEKRRMIPISDAGFRSILRRWIDLRGDQPGHLFPSKKGGRLSERSIQERVGEIGRRCGVEDLRCHRLRHTFGKRMADAGVPIQTIAGLMGHSSLEITRRYIQPGEDDLREAVGLVRMGKLGKGR